MTIGCDHLVVAKLTKDNGTDLTYETPVRLPGLMKIGIVPNSSNATAFYDNGPGETATTMGAIEVTVDKNALSASEQALLLGKNIDAKGVIISGSDDVPPEVALGFRTLKSNGKFKYVWLYKGTFAEPESEVETKGESINFQATTLKANFVKVNKMMTFNLADNKTITKQPWKVELDAEGENADATTMTKWFDAVYVPGATPTALAEEA